MTIEDVKDSIKKIKESRHDDERAHSLEDDLHWDLLSAIANGECDNAKECAAIAITSRRIKFERWCA